MKTFRYKNVILYASHQWCGNIEQYFSETSEKLVVLLLMPRIQTDQNLIRIYHKGKISKEVKISLSENFFLYYIKWNIHYLRVLFFYFSNKEKVIVISFHVYQFFLMSIQRLLRNVKFVFWVGDYYPPLNISLTFYEWLKRYYHDRIEFTYYLGDGVNEKMNGKIVNLPTRKTIMWGVNPQKIAHKTNKNTLLCVGVIRPSSGLELVYEFLKQNKKYNLKVIGVCDNKTYALHKQLIKKNDIKKQVSFPNKFFTQEELNELSKECFVGLAPYTIDSTNVIYYSDPGKIKTYAEMNMPVIITKTSNIVSYVKKFKSGIVIDRTAQSLKNAIEHIQNDYQKYMQGVKEFNRFFYYKRYYSQNFSALENL